MLASLISCTLVDGFGVNADLLSWVWDAIFVCFFVSVLDSSPECVETEESLC